MNYKIILIMLLFSGFKISAQNTFQNEGGEENETSFFHKSSEELLHRNALIKSQVITDEIKKALENDDELAQAFRSATYNRFRVNERGAPFNYQTQILKEFINYRNEKGNKLMIANGGWQSLGPYTISNINGNSTLGRLNTVEAAPNDTNTLYVGAAGGGLWKSSNAGLNWTCLTEGLPINGVIDIAIDPVNPSVIYFLSGDLPGGDNPSAGVFKSYDGGTTWHATGLVFELDSVIGGHCLKINPVDHNSIHVGTNRGYYYSSNGGVTWSVSYPTLNVQSIDFRPGNGRYVIMAGVYEQFQAIQIFLSSDTGHTFVSAKAQYTGTKIRTAVSPANPNIVFATDIAFMSGQWRQRLYKSSNGGVSYSNALIINYLLDSAIGTYGGAKFSFFASPTDTNVVYVGAITVNKLQITSPNSATLSLINGDKHADTQEMRVIGQRFYVATDGGLFYAYSPNTVNQSWVNLSAGLNISQITGFGGSEADPDLFVYGTWDNGIFSMNNGIATGEIAGCDGFNGKIAASNSSYWFGSCNGGLNRKAGAGPWIYINGSPTMNGEGVTAISVDPTNPDVIYTIGTHAYKTIDGGTSWTKLNNPDSTVYHEKLVCAPSAFNAKLYTSNDAGQIFRRYISTWTDITYNLPTSNVTTYRKVSAIAVSTTNTNLVYVTISGYLAGNKVFRFNGINSWTNISGTLPNVNVSSIVYENNGSNGLYIGTDIGVFYKNDLLADWIPFMNGMPHIEATEFFIRYSDNTITAATYGRGLWRSQLYTTCPAYLNVPLPSGVSYNGYWAYQAGDSITCSISVASGAGNELRLQADDQIILQPDFAAYAGSEFSAVIGSCDTFIQAAKPLNGVLIDGVSFRQSDPVKKAEQKQLETTVKNISISPNPFNDKLEFKIFFTDESDLIIELYDIMGNKAADVTRQKKIIAGNFTCSFAADKLKKGVYLAKIISNGNLQVTKLVKY